MGLFGFIFRHQPSVHSFLHEMSISSPSCRRVLVCSRQRSADRPVSVLNTRQEYCADANPVTHHFVFTNISTSRRKAEKSKPL